MSKKISVWLTAGLIIAVATVTFLTTLLLGGTLVYANDAEGIAATSENASEPKQEVSANDITAKLSRKIAELAYYYSKYYIGDIDIDDIVEGVAEGFVAYSGDKYGQYHNKEEYKDLTADYSGEFAGIGVSVVYNSEYSAIEIMNVMPDSPALEGGILPNDLVVAVEGEDVAFLGYNEAINRIRGDIGTTVTLTILRGDNYTERFDVILTRRAVQEQTVTYEEIGAELFYRPLAYISVTAFNNKTPEQFKEALGQGLTNRARGYIIDMRNNGGGTLDSVVKMLDMILPEGPVVRIQYKDGTETVYESDELCFSEPIVVLVNGNTASAAELFTSALRDYGKAIIIGDTTFGKGTVQTLFKLSDGSALRLSTAMYAPPLSDNFEGVGITPDIQVSLAEEYKNVNLFNLDIENDAQLQAAINLYK